MVSMASSMSTLSSTWSESAQQKAALLQQKEIATLQKRIHSLDKSIREKQKDLKTHRSRYRQLRSEPLQSQDSLATTMSEARRDYEAVKKDIDYLQESRNKALSQLKKLENLVVSPSKRKAPEPREVQDDTRRRRRGDDNESQDAQGANAS
jgi:chromosome segregation ATPase